MAHSDQPALLGFACNQVYAANGADMAQVPAKGNSQDIVYLKCLPLVVQSGDKQELWQSRQL